MSTFRPQVGSIESTDHTAAVGDAAARLAATAAVVGVGAGGGATAPVVGVGAGGGASTHTAGDAGGADHRDCEGERRAQ